MKSKLGYRIKAMALVVISLFTTGVNAAVEDFRLSVRNLQQTAPDRIEFEVYLLDTDAGQPFEMASCQLGFLINSLIYTGGTLSVAIDNTGSELNTVQQFSALPAVITPLSGYPDQTLIRLAAGTIVGPGSGTIISTTGYGTLLTRFIITSTVDFIANSQPNLVFTSTNVSLPLYPTRVAEFIANLSTPLIVTAGENAVVDGNPVLNPPTPTAYSVTGGGEYCDGGAGVEVGLSDSEAGVTYTLVHGTDSITSVDGSGDPISFGLQTGAGTYTVRGTNAGGTTPMDGSATVTIAPLPSVPAAQAGSEATCNQITANWNSVTGAISYQLDVSTSNTFATFVTGYQNRDVGNVLNQNVTGLVTGTTYYYRVRAVNGCGASGNSGTITYATLSVPVQPDAITGPASVCQGQSEVSYAVPSVTSATSYSWNYSGTGATITGTTNNVNISFAANATSGTLTVRGINSCGNGTLSAGFPITVNALPAAPGIGAIIQPTCSVRAGSVELRGLPGTGTWSLTRNTGGTPITNSGTTYTVTGLPEDTHTFTVTNENGCASPASDEVEINIPPAIPTAPVMGTVTQPTCAVTTGSVGISGLPPTGTWILTSDHGGTDVSGIGTAYTLSGIQEGIYTFTVTNDAGCVSPASEPITVTAPLPVPAVPVQAVNCADGFDHAKITVNSPTGAGYEYRLNSGTWQTSNIFNDVVNANYTITVRNSSGCTSTGEQFTVNCGCVNPPLLTLGATAGSTCGITAVTVSGNTFGGSATSVTFSDDGGGTVSPASSGISPFAFTYTPTAADAGRTVVITVTTNNPIGGLCTAASATYTLTVNALPTAPVPGTRTHPTCTLPTGSVVLNSLPGSGDWTITRTPGGQTSTGSGTSTTITGLAPGTYTFTVTNSNGCVSASSSNVVINTQPDTPVAPMVGTIVQPTCALSTGSVELSGLPETGTWTLTRTPGNVTIPGTGVTRTVSAIPPGTYTFTVTNAAGCVSPASAEVIINLQPVTPSSPGIGDITAPTCSLATGSVVLENMPETGEWTLIRYPGGVTSTGTGSSATISSLPAGIYNFAVRNAEGCTSPVSGNAVIDPQPLTPTAPAVGAITHPTFQVPTGSVVLSGLPASGEWTLIRYPDGFTSPGTGTTRTVSGLEPGTYTFAVTNSDMCTSELTGDVVIKARPGAPVVVINNPPAICENETTDLTDPAVTAGSDANLTFTYWTDEAATVAYTTPSAAPAGTYYIMGTSTAGYSTIKSLVVTADQMPVANAGQDQPLDYLFGTTLNAEIPEIGTGIWALVSGTGDLFNSAEPSTTVSGLSVGDNVFSWTVTNGVCDPVSDFVLVRVNDLLIPTLITPNDDGYNDVFSIHGLEETLGRTELIIFDRRGLKVWESRDYKNNWDGRDYNSNPLPEETYFWVLRADNGVSVSGYIVIRR